MPDALAEIGSNFMKFSGKAAKPLPLTESLGSVGAK